MKKVQMMKKSNMTQMTHNDVHIWSTPPCLPFPMPITSMHSLFHAPRLCSQSGTIVFHVAHGCHTPNMFGTVDIEKVS